MVARHGLKLFVMLSVVRIGIRITRKAEKVPDLASVFAPSHAF